MKRIVIINGVGGAGKDALCEFAAQHYHANNISKVENISSIDPIKKIAKKAGWHGKKDEKSRKFLSDLKAVFVAYNDYPTKWLVKKTLQFLDDEYNILLFVHIREAAEIQKYIDSVNNYVNKNTVFTVLIKDDSSETVWHNASDDNVENFNYDFIFHNKKNTYVSQEESIRRSGESFVKMLDQHVFRDYNSGDDTIRVNKVTES
jgi:hypothetical protein